MTTKTKAAGGAEDPDEPFRTGGVVPAGSTYTETAGEHVLPADQISAAGRVVELQVGERWQDITEDVLSGRTVIDFPGHVSPASALELLREYRKLGEPVAVDFPPGRSRDQVVVDGHAYDGEWVDRGWRFTPQSLDMACRVAGWSTVEHVEPGKVRLS